MPFFLRYFGFKQFQRSWEQLLGINEATVTVKPQIPLVLFPICSCRMSSIHETLRGCLTSTQNPITSCRTQLLLHYLHLGTHWKLPYPPVPCYSIGHETFECQSSALFHHEVGEYTSLAILVRGLIRSIACTTMNISVLENCYVGFCFHAISASPIPPPCLLSEGSLKE